MHLHHKAHYCAEKGPLPTSTLGKLLKCHNAAVKLDVSCPRATCAASRVFILLLKSRFEPSAGDLDRVFLDVVFSGSETGREAGTGEQLCFLFHRLLFILKNGTIHTPPPTLFLRLSIQ